MAIPSKLKKLYLFNQGNAYIGETASVTLPKLTRKFEAWRGGGMPGAVKIDMGFGDDLDLEWTLSAPMLDVLRQFGITNASGIFLRFSGAYENDGTGRVDTVEVTVRGRHEEIDMGEAKAGEAGEFKVKTACTYYRLDWNGTTEIEIDLINDVFVVGGVDRNAELRAALF